MTPYNNVINCVFNSFFKYRIIPNKTKKTSDKQTDATKGDPDEGYQHLEIQNKLSPSGIEAIDKCRNKSVHRSAHCGETFENPSILSPYRIYVKVCMGCQGAGPMLNGAPISVIKDM